MKRFQSTLEAIEAISNQWVEPCSALYKCPVLLAIWKLATDELLRNQLEWKNQDYYDKLKKYYDILIKDRLNENN